MLNKMVLKGDEKYNVVLTGLELSLIQKALIELPFKEVSKLIIDFPNKITPLTKES